MIITAYNELKDGRLTIYKDNGKHIAAVQLPSISAFVSSSSAIPARHIAYSFFRFASRTSGALALSNILRKTACRISGRLARPFDDWSRQAFVKTASCSISGVKDSLGLLF